MKNSRVAPLLPVISICLALGFGVVQGPQRSSLLGDWTGESICVGNNPSCHDEKVIYHVSVAGEPDKIKIAADKIVDGKPEPMGVIDLKYDASKQTLTGETQTARYHLFWEFTVKGNIMEGTLSVLPDKTIARRIKVQKNESTQKGAGARFGLATFFPRRTATAMATAPHHFPAVITRASFQLHES